MIVCSILDHLKEPLQEYIDKLDRVSLVRASVRSGLIRARLIGFEQCTADVAIFLDSHCEATPGTWFVLPENNNKYIITICQGNISSRN